MTEKEERKEEEKEKKVCTGYLDLFQFIRMRIFIAKVQIVLKGYNCLLVYI